jgi:hypothetical protein
MALITKLGIEFIIPLRPSSDNMARIMHSSTSLFQATFSKSWKTRTSRAGARAGRTGGSDSTRQTTSRASNLDRLREAAVEATKQSNGFHRESEKCCE